MSKKKKNQIGKIFTITGLLLFAAALALFAYNLWDGYRAEQSREKLLEEYRDKNQNISDKGEQADESDGQIPDYQLNPEMEMPEIALEDLDGAACIGVLEIPAIDLKLPVLSEWSYPLLKKAPCRYSGSAYLDNLVIAAHNYRTHFGKLKELETGDEVIFTEPVRIQSGGGRSTDSTKRGRYDKWRMGVELVHLYAGWKEQGDGAV